MKKEYDVWVGGVAVVENVSYIKAMSVYNNYRDYDHTDVRVKLCNRDLKENGIEND